MDEYTDHPRRATVTSVTPFYGLSGNTHRHTVRLPRVPWFSLFLGLLIAYQVSPEFQGWVNYQVRAGLKWPSWFVAYTLWWLRQPAGRSDLG